MKKTVFVIAFIIVAALIIINLPKNNSSEKMNDKKSIESKIISTDKMEESDITQVNALSYVDYSKTSYDQMNDKKRVFFFHAKWCPTCKIANDEFLEKIDEIPSGVILFKTDYDTEKELKSQYGITYQHTFVYVDSQGKEIKKWNGGGIAELISNTSQ